MKYLLFLLVISLSTNLIAQKMYIFTSKTNIKEWKIVNDGVMGGVSKSTLELNEAGNGKFSGFVSLENNGGFASVQLNNKVMLDDNHKFIVMRIKGDGKNYEFRLKGAVSQQESYVHAFNTSGEWEEIKLPIAAFYPQFRGQKLKSPNFNFNKIEQMSFLIANKKEENFTLLIDWMGLE